MALIRQDYQNVQFAQRIIGSGSPAAKTSMLEKYKDLIETAGFNNVPKVALTPGFFNRYLESAKALDKEDNRDKCKAIKDGVFSVEELKIFWDIIGPNEGFLLAVRSDEFSAKGTGAFYSGFFLNTGTKEERLKKFSSYLKSVLSSQFSDTAVEFKKRIGATSTIGVQVCPVIGDNVDIGDLMGTYVFTTLMTGAGFSSYLGASQIYAAPGFGGYGVSFMAKNDLRRGLSEITGFRIHDDTTIAAYKSGDSRLSPVTLSNGMLAEKFMEKVYDLVDLIYGKAEQLGKDGIPKYFEFSSSDLFTWLLLGPNKSPFFITQIDDFILPDVKIPESAKTNAIWKATQVIGSKIVDLDGLLFTSDSMINEIPQLLEGTEGKRFGLVLSGGVIAVPEKRLKKLEQIDAVIYLVRHQNPLVGHSAGLFREAGIPVFTTSSSIDIQNLPSSEMDKPLLVPLKVYSSEKTQEGYVCPR